VGRRRWRIATLLGIGVLVNYFDRVNISVAHDALHREFGISTVMFGYLLSSFNWTYALLQLPMGVLLDRYGVKPIGRFSALLWTLASLGSAAAPSLGAFFGTRLLLGIGEAPTFPANVKAIGYWFPREERSMATAMFDAAAKLGAAIGIPAVGFVLIHFGWRASFAATGVISLLYFWAFWLVYRDPDDDPGLSQEERLLMERKMTKEEFGSGAPLGVLITQRKILGLVTGFFGYNYCFYLLLLWLPTYFGSLKLNAWDSVVYTGIPWLVAAISDLAIGGYLVDRLVRKGCSDTVVRQSVLITGTALGLAIAGPMFTTDPKVALFWITLALAGLAAAAPVGWSIPSLIAPRPSVGKVGGILNFGNQVSGIVAPIVTGYITRETGSMKQAFAVGAVLLLLGIAAYVFLLGRIEPEERNA
jgi:ACS family D-galactonate transporter-like MFS transporter